MTTTETKYRTITLTDRAPVRIREDLWPIIAHGSFTYHDGTIRQQANRLCDIDIRVRQHADGRSIVYGIYKYDTHFAHEQCEIYRVGVLLEPNADLTAAIKEIGNQLIERINDSSMHRHVRDTVDDCIADLPPETLD